jgi:hypothetical protein
MSTTFPSGRCVGWEPDPIGSRGAWLGYKTYLAPCKLVDGVYRDQDPEKGDDIWDEVIVRYGGIRPLQTEFGELHKRWEGSASRITTQNLGEPGSGVAAFFERALDSLRGERDDPPKAEPAQRSGGVSAAWASPEMRLKASCLGEFEGLRRKIDGVDFPLFRIKLWVDPPAPLPPDETETRRQGLRADDWAEYHLHPYRNGIRRRANRGPKGDFSLIIFTRDDY